MIDDLPAKTNALVLSYIGIRRAIGFSGLLLPIALGPIGWLFGVDIQDNISSYYHTPLRDVFVPRPRQDRELDGKSRLYLGVGRCPIPARRGQRSASSKILDRLFTYRQRRRLLSHARFLLADPFSAIHGRGSRTACRRAELCLPHQRHGDSGKYARDGNVPVLIVPEMGTDAEQLQLLVLDGVDRRLGFCRCLADEGTHDRLGTRR